MAPLDPDKMKQKEKQDALKYLMLLTKKHCGQIKGRVLADGRKQCDNTPQDDASSSTVSTAVLMLSCIIDAKENRDVATLHVPNAFV
eukprot:1791439-Ditylum_brightwellii.AAC.1